jgi:hypothetical protein
MDTFLKKAKDRADALGVHDIVVATLNGGSVRDAREAFGDGYSWFAVSNPSSAHEKGLVYHDGMSQETQKALEAEGIRVILADQGIFQTAAIGGPPYPIGADVPEFVWQGNHKRKMDLHIIKTFGDVVNKVIKKELSPVWLVTGTIGALMGDGPAVCLEITLIAADSGILPIDKDCLAISRPRPASHAPDTAMVLRPCKTPDLLRAFRIKDLLLVPRPDDHWFNNKRLWSNG